MELLRTHAPPAQGAGAPRVPLTRMDNADPNLMSELLEAVERTARAAAFTLGEEVEAFESEFAAACGTAYAVGVSSGTDAIALSLRAMGIGPGDEVIVPTNSFIATAEAVSLVGATPKFVDVDPDTHLITAQLVDPAISPRVRAVIVVHLFGRTVEMEPILGVAREHGVRVIEDAAQAHGACYRGRRIGSLGDCGCFSFYPTKNLGGWGDGGAITTSDAGLAARVRLLRSHGEQPRDYHLVPGTTARLDTIQAAVLRVKLRRLDENNEARRVLALRLGYALADTAIVPPPTAGAGHDHVYHQYVVRSESRDRLREHLAACGVASAVHYPTPIHLSPAYARPDRPKLAVAERLAQAMCSLPMYPSMTDDEFELLVDSCATFDPRPVRLAHA